MVVSDAPEMDPKALRREAKRVEARLRDLDIQLERAFPDYRELIDPPPISIATVKDLLAPDEALILYLVLSGDSFAWVLRRDSQRFLRLGVDEVS